MRTPNIKSTSAIIRYGIKTLSAIASNKVFFSSKVAPFNFSLVSSIPDNKRAPKIREPKAPAVLFAIPIIAIRLAPLSIGPKIVMYGFAAVCKIVIPTP